MHTDIIIKKRTTRIYTVLSVCSLVLYTTACDSGEFPGKEKDPLKTELRFTASISDSPSTKAVHGSDITEGAIFPDGTHPFGMFITGEGGGELVAGSGDNMKLTLTKSGSTETWSQTDKNDAALSLVAKHGESINLSGYYPWTAGASSSSIPFDLSGDMSTCTDLLYLSSPAVAQPVYDATPIALNFSHAYCWVTINLSKLTQKNNVLVKSVRIENSSNNLKRVMNKGTINPKTGDVVTGTSGPLVIDCATPVDIPLSNQGITPLAFNFLVPPFMRADVQDSEIIIRVTTQVSSGADEVLSFPLNRVHLNNTAGTNQYGFEKGMHDTYNLVYNNGEMILSLSDWQGVWIGDSKLGEGTANVKPFEVPYKDNGVAPQQKLKRLARGNHINHTYLGEVAENNNGKYIKIAISDVTTLGAWEPYMTTEPFYEPLKVARNDAAGGSPVPWKDQETGVLAAKQACAEFREGGYTDWRLPRISELFMLIYDTPSGLRLLKDEYWSATEYDENECYTVSYLKPDAILKTPRHIPKTASFYVRCVRDSDKPNPTI